MKKSSIIKPVFCLAIVFIFILVGAFFAFIPWHSGSKTYRGFYNSIGIDGSFVGTVCAIYDIKNEATEKEIELAKENIRNILREEGYGNTNIFLVGEDRLRIEISMPRSESDFVDAQNLLDAIGVGNFELKLTNEADALSYVNGTDHIEKVDVVTYQGQYSVRIKFRDDASKGKEKYIQLTKVAEEGDGKIYIFMGGLPFPEEGNNVLSGMTESVDGNMYLTFETLEAAEAYKLAFSCGSIGVSLNSETVRIFETDALMGRVQKFMVLGDTPTHTNTLITLIQVVIWSLFIIMIAYMIEKYGALGVIAGMSMLVIAIGSMFFMWVIDWVELGLSSFAGIVLGLAFIVFINILWFEKIKTEFNLGKTIPTSVTVGTEKAKPRILELSLVAIVFGGILAIASYGPISVFGTVFAIIAIMNLISVYVISVPFVNMVLEYKLPEKYFKLTKEQSNENKG